MRRTRGAGVALAAGGLAVLVITYILGSSGLAAPAEPSAFTVSLTTGQEIPAVRAETPGGAGGVAAVVFNAARSEVGFALTYSGLSGRVTLAHFHRAPAGEAGAVVQTICGAPPPAIAGACPDGNAATIAGVWRIPDALMADWQAGRIYFNVHTALNPGGEIRGQIFPAR